jgi:hypothetical protein
MKSSTFSLVGEGREDCALLGRRKRPHRGCEGINLPLVLHNDKKFRDKNNYNRLPLETLILFWIQKEGLTTNLQP